MGSTFNPQILVDKLAKLNSSQQSIETLSHWCIFHMNKAKLVVETWDKQFHCSPREQRLAFLYLANDILQNSRRKGAEFVGEFWRFLPDALSDVIENGDDFGRNAVLRMIGIWEERKVFGSRGQILKDEIEKRPIDCNTRNGKHSGLKLKHPFGNTVDRIISAFQAVYGSQLDEDAMLIKCTNAIGHVEKLDKEICSNISSERLHDSSLPEELQGQHNILRDCVEQIAMVESSTEKLVAYLREALQEQEYKLGQIRIQHQAAKAGALQADNISQQLLNRQQQPQPLQENHADTMSRSNGDSLTSSIPPSHTSPQILPTGNGGEPLPPPTHNEDDNRKSTAAAMADKLAASTSSAQMLTYVLSSLASEGVIGNLVENTPLGDTHFDKRLKHNEEQQYPFPQTTQLPSPPPPPSMLPHTNSSPAPAPAPAVTIPEMTSKQQLPTPQPSLHLLPPCIPPFGAPFATPTPPGLPSNPPFFYAAPSQQMMQQPLMAPQSVGAPSPPGFTIPLTHPYQSFEEGGDRVLFGHHLHHHQSSLPTVPISRK